MSGFKDPSYLERKSAATDAKKAALERFRARRSADEPVAEIAAKTASVGEAPETKPANTRSPKARESNSAKGRGKQS
ncbi:MAG TPA: DUF6481 family protein [Xanthobacteraceae bacterium]|jgi:hypothetical protein|nr:DUF6481 family protein [Xanthobacteraceae bacterium]